MKKPFSIKRGNRGLLPEEEQVVEFVNAVLEASATKHGLTLSAGSKFTVKDVTTGNQTVRRPSSAPSGPTGVVVGRAVAAG